MSLTICEEDFQKQACFKLKAGKHHNNTNIFQKLIRIDSKIITIMLDQLQYLEINVYALALLYNDYSIHIIKTISFISL